MVSPRQWDRYGHAIGDPTAIIVHVYVFALHKPSHPCHIRGMKTHQIVAHAGAFRIQATSPTGKHWLLSRVYPTEAEAQTRLGALDAMAEADQQMKALAAQPRPRDAHA
jgi:hypothetical protein